MTSINYPSPVNVNGYSCKNCTDVDYAKKNIDPAHPTEGPFGVDKARSGKIDAAKDAQKAHAAASNAGTPAVTFGGVLASLSQSATAPSTPSATQGLRVNLSV